MGKETKLFKTILVPVDFFPCSDCRPLFNPGASYGNAQNDNQ